MTRSTVKIGATVAIVCTRERREKRCACGRPATKLCDFPKGRGTCDKPLCDRCAVAAGPDRDHCPDHPAPAQGGAAVTAPSASPRDDQRRRELAAIHTAKKQLGLDDDAYRDFLAAQTGKRSAAELDAGERRRVIDELRRLGFAKQYAPSPKDEDFVYHARKEHRLIAALWRNLWLLGEVSDPGPRALDHFVQRQADVAALKWLAPEKAAVVVQALKDWLGRAGFLLPEKTKGRKNAVKIRRALVRALWRRLEAAGALTFENDDHRAAALDNYFDKYCSPCRKGIGHPMTTADELDACADRLGAWLRQAKATPIE